MTAILRIAVVAGLASNRRNPYEAVTGIFDHMSGLEKPRELDERRLWARSSLGVRQSADSGPKGQPKSAKQLCLKGFSIG